MLFDQQNMTVRFRLRHDFIAFDKNVCSSAGIPKDQGVGALET